MSHAGIDDDDVPMDNEAYEAPRDRPRPSSSRFEKRAPHRPPRRPPSAPRSGTEGSDRVCQLYAEMDPPVFAKNILRFSFRRVYEDDKGRERETGIAPPEKEVDELTPEAICDQSILSVFGDGIYAVVCYGLNGQALRKVRVEVGDCKARDSHGGSSGRHEPLGPPGEAYTSFPAMPSLGPMASSEPSSDHQTEALKDRKEYLQKLEDEAVRLREQLHHEAEQASRKDRSMMGDMAQLLGVMMQPMIAMNAQRSPGTSDAFSQVSQAQIESERTNTRAATQRGDLFMQQYNKAVEDNSQLRADHRKELEKNDENWRSRYKDLESKLEDKIDDLKKKIDELNRDNMEVTKGKMGAETDLKIAKAGAGDKGSVIEEVAKALPFLSQLIPPGMIPGGAPPG